MVQSLKLTAGIRFCISVFIFLSLQHLSAAAQDWDDGEGEPFFENEPEVEQEEAPVKRAGKPSSTAIDRAKEQSERRLRERYARQRRLRELQRRQRAQELKRKREELARQRDFEDKLFRRRSLLGSGLHEDRMREEHRTGVLPSTIEGSARLEGRYFPVEAEDPKTVNENLSVLGELEMGYNFGKVEVKLWNLGRYDVSDKERNRILPYENWVGYISDTVRIKLGMQIENWAMTEVFAPSDIFNSRNLDSQFENSEKLGEPSLSLRVKLAGGYATFFYMPFFTAPIMPSEESRLSSLPVGSKLLDTVFLQDAKLNEKNESVSQYAMRYVRKIGDADLGVHYIHHIDRSEPHLAQDMMAMGLRPIYLPVNQIGMNGSLIWGEGIYKFDIVRRSFPESNSFFGLMEKVEKNNHSILALGMEYPFVHEETGWESTLFLEWQKLLDADKALQQSTLNQNDVLAGYRLTFNDLKVREVTAFLIADMENSGEFLWSIAYTQKLTSKIKLAAGWREVLAKSQISKTLDEVDHAFLNLTYFF